ncbi:unnamed protein product [Danaus chrysippus]|uniref:(African queen) hypothetical protein n=1 Tax=Danaus chrysippus TaxID=151541 RepID=A0A8J2W655_9NEOP|nr:unnamed protein product [Danaus chrysippus]
MMTSQMTAIKLPLVLLSVSLFLLAVVCVVAQRRYVPPRTTTVADNFLEVSSVKCDVLKNDHCGSLDPKQQKYYVTFPPPKKPTRPPPRPRGGNADEDGIVWPKEYHLKGEMTFMSIGLQEPFEIWYSAVDNKSRIDYYDGTVKRYYVGEEEDEGEEYNIFPVFIEKEMTVMCVKQPSDGGVTDFLIDPSNFTYSDTTSYNGKTVQVWKNVEIELNKEKVEQVLYVYKQDGVHIPIRVEEIKHNLWTGALEGHKITTYYDYSKPTESDFNVELVSECEDASDFYNDLKLLHPMIPSDVDRLYHSYKKHHNRNYKAEEHELRKSILEQNWQRVILHNKKNLGFKLTLNKYSDRTNEELSVLTGTRPSSGTGSVSFPHTDEEVEQMVLDLPENYDMRLEGTISAVKNQGHCGSCWTFSTTAAVEGALARKNGGRDLDLSEQSIVDCAWGYHNAGCDGGMIDTAFKYILDYGIPTQIEYGDYLGEDGYCHIENVTNVYNIIGFVQVPSKSVNAMKVALYKYGPVSVAINADKMLLAYESGVFFDPECNEEGINHAVTVVGYGVRDGATYWIVKNSWGEDWGQDGYLLISATDNNCHILEYAYYPLSGATVYSTVVTPHPSPVSRHPSPSEGCSSLNPCPARRLVGRASCSNDLCQWLVENVQLSSAIGRYIRCQPRHCSIVSNPLAKDVRWQGSSIFLQKAYVSSLPSPTTEEDEDEDETTPSRADADDGRVYKNPRNSPSAQCPRDEEQATLLGQKCLRKCSSDEDCKSKKKKCLCDGACGMSCIKPGE